MLLKLLYDNYRPRQTARQCTMRRVIHQPRAWPKSTPRVRTHTTFPTHAADAHNACASIALLTVIVMMQSSHGASTSSRSYTSPSHIHCQRPNSTPTTYNSTFLAAYRLINCFQCTGKYDRRSHNCSNPSCCEGNLCNLDTTTTFKSSI